MFLIQMGGGAIHPSVDVPAEFVELHHLDGRYNDGASAVPAELWKDVAESIHSRMNFSEDVTSTKPAAAQPDLLSRGSQAKAQGEALRIDRIHQRYRLFPSAFEIISHAHELAGKGINNITSGLLLAAISSRGEVTANPRWAPAWLRTRWADEGNKRLIEIARRNAKDGQPNTPSQVPVLTPGADAVIAHARAIALRTTDNEEIRVRHLLGAILSDPRGESQSSALGALKELGHGYDIVKLREGFFDFVRGWDDDDDAWGEILLGARTEAPLLAEFDADSDKGEDQLDIKSDVLAFAGLIAARTLKPPLSIGLFGEWGSGKTFFMRMLARQVAALAREGREATTRDKTRQRNQPFYRRIVQIEFNAWHYAEGNLWASLVQHIFDNLRVIDDKRRVSQDLQEPILQKLNVEKAAQAQARRERDNAKWQRQAAMRAVKDAKKKFEDKAIELAQISGRNVLADVPSEALARAFTPLLEDLGINAAISRGVELRTTLAEARTMLGRGHAAFAPLLTSKDRGRRSLYLGMALLAGPAAAIVAETWLPGWLGKQGVSTITVAATGAAGFITSITAWLRHQLTWVGDRLKQIEDVQRQFDLAIEQAQAENLKSVREAEERLRLLEADYVAAQRKEEEAQRRVVEAVAKVKEATVPRLLTTFIEERANSTDYRKHLGMLALVRNDFEKLSDLIAEENEQLDGVLKDGKDPFPTIEDELKDEEKRINRIVLYIDDLDRCPPAKVVEVLQAVHLLLAFPLFVVVVGVDARWVLRSIETRYRELLASDGQAANQEKVDEFKQLFGHASAHDYVEKIFQVPFWLKPMTPDASRRLVRDLLKASIVNDPPSNVAPLEPRPAVKGSMVAASPPPGAPGGPPDDDEVFNLNPDLSDVDLSGLNLDLEEERRTPTDLSPEGLEITRAELEEMSNLAPLLGRSPRTLKRFVNVYRLIRVGLSPYERSPFLSDEHGFPDYRAVLLLLAVDTGAPKVAAPFFNKILEMSRTIPSAPERKGKGRTRPSGANALLEQLNDDDAINSLEDWPRVHGWMLNHSITDDVQRLARWIPRVSRFSFHTGRI